MRIVVCIKQVPVSQEMYYDNENYSLNRTTLKNELNKNDLCAFQEALKLKEKYNGTVIVVSMGVVDAKETLIETKAMGADRIILLNDSKFAGSDTYATAYVLSKAIKKIGNVDIVICGQQTSDGETGQVGGQLAEFLQVSSCTYVNKIEDIGQDYIICSRVLDQCYIVQKQALPIVMSIKSRNNKEYIYNIRDFLKALKYEIEVWNANDLEISQKECGLTGSYTRVKNIKKEQRQVTCEWLSSNDLIATAERIYDVVKKI